ncbi:MAG TPA: NAD-dependent epimerase/dehydratase family protein, partial [Candidatus Polarisedimenticolia bacterium]|nr:NAD-dependent epimerase/dehydratase family protein [Candidatus Polarisedimenticolia bacterium]
IREPLSFFTENLDMGRNLVHACHRAWVKRLINLGSSCMYPRNAKNPLTEEMILTGELEPTNEGYALAKIAVARLCEYVSRQDNAFEYKTLLPCNLFGRHDKFDPGQSHFIAAALHKVHLAKANEEKSVEVWGDGSARREFMYAGDLAHCLVEAVNRFESLPETMNVGTGEDLTIDEYYRLVASVVGYQGEFKHDVSKPVGMQRKLLDVSRAKSWGWKSQTPLRKALEQTYDFYLHGTGNASGQELSVGKSDLG